MVTYGLSPQADLVAHDLRPSAEGNRFRVRHAVDGELGEIQLPMPGTHNVRNTLAAVAVGRAVGLDFEAIAKALACFGGVHRRFERVGEFQGATVVDDYAHHPTEVAATLEAARQAFPEGRIHAIFQPHLFSRTRDLCDELGRSLLGADEAVVTAIYASREKPMDGVSGENVVESARRSGHRRAEYCAEWRELPELLAGRVAPGDVVLTLGAGDIYRLSRLLAEKTP